ncbi:MAG: hypothetical protein JNL24_11730 [Bacteroidia bacterium]|nr:hypothetical protein [Bacteroidia bacterium]
MRKIYGFIMISMIISCKQDVEYVEYHLPDNFVGTVLVVFDQAKFNYAIQKSDTIVYQIPESGVLFVKNENRYSGKIMPAYYKNSFGKTVREINFFLPIMNNKIALNSSEIFIFNISSGSKMGKNGKKIHYDTFTIAPRNIADSVANANIRLKGNVLDSL